MAADDYQNLRDDIRALGEKLDDRYDRLDVQLQTLEVQNVELYQILSNRVSSLEQSRTFMRRAFWTTVPTVGGGVIVGLVLYWIGCL